MKRTYQRSQVLYFHELTHEQQAKVIEDISPDDDESEHTFVLWNNEPLPLNMFMRSEGLFHGTYLTSAFSAYLIRLNETSESATVVYAHW